MSRDWRVLLIVPAYNEGQSIVKTCAKIRDYDFVVINDGSTDNTEEILSENSLPHLTLAYNLGIGGAIQTGYKYAYKNNYDIAIQFDGDGQHSIDSVESLIRTLGSKKADMVIGSRFVSQGMDNFRSSAMRRAGVKIISWFIKLRTGQKIYDTTSGFRAVNRKMMKFFAENYSVEYPEPISTTEALLNGFKVVEVPAKMQAREKGKSSISKLKSAYYMINVCLQILVIRRKHE